MVRWGSALARCGGSRLRHSVRSPSEESDRAERPGEAPPFERARDGARGSVIAYRGTSVRLGSGHEGDVALGAIDQVIEFPKVPLLTEQPRW